MSWSVSDYEDMPTRTSMRDGIRVRRFPIDKDR